MSLPEGGPEPEDVGFHKTREGLDNGEGAEPVAPAEPTAEVASGAADTEIPPKQPADDQGKPSEEVRAETEEPPSPEQNPPVEQNAQPKAEEEKPEGEPPVGRDPFYEEPWGKIESRTRDINSRAQEFISRYVMPFTELEIKKATHSADVWERCLLGWNRWRVERGLQWMLGHAEKEKIRLGQLQERFDTAEAASKRLALAADELEARDDLLTPRQKERLADIQTQIQEMAPFLARLSGELEAQRTLVNEYGDSIVRSADSAGMETVKKAGEGYLIKDKDFIGKDPGERFDQRMEDLMGGVWSDVKIPESVKASLGQGKSIFERLFAWLVALDERRTPLTEPPKSNSGYAAVQPNAQPAPQPGVSAKQKK